MQIMRLRFCIKVCIYKKLVSKVSLVNLYIYPSFLHIQNYQRYNLHPIGRPRVAHLERLLFMID